MKKPFSRFVLFTALLFAIAANAAPIETFQFDSPETEQTFHKLSEELRCLVCQNQNIAESNAELAQDLRLEMYNMLASGKTEDEIVDFMVQRYGDYVLYRPPFKPMTWLLWFGPLIIFIMGVIFAVRFMRSQAEEKPAEALSEEDLQRVKSLHDDMNAKVNKEQGEK